MTGVRSRSINARSINALTRAVIFERTGQPTQAIPLEDRPTEAEVLRWAQTVPDSRLRQIRNLGAGSIAWIREQMVIPARPDYDDTDALVADLVTLVWHAGFEEGLRAGRAVGAAGALDLVGAAFVEGMLTTGALHGSKDAEAVRALRLATVFGGPPQPMSDRPR